MSGRDDQYLVQRVAAGEIDAFETLYDRHSARALNLAMRITGRPRAAEEVTQDAFLGLWRSASAYDAGKGTPGTWLLSIVRNRSIDWLRREARHDRDVEIDERLLDHLEALERTDQRAITHETQREARQLLLGLPVEQRRVIELTYFRGLSHREIAAKIGIPLGTVKGRQRLALLKMHQALKGGREAVFSS